MEWVSESTSHSKGAFRDGLSARILIRKMHPIPSANSGTRLPLGMPFGNRVPFWQWSAMLLLGMEHVYVIASYNIRSYNVHMFATE